MDLFDLRTSEIRVIMAARRKPGTQIRSCSKHQQTPNRLSAEEVDEVRTKVLRDMEILIA